MREEATPRPSPRAVERFEQGLDVELGDLRSRLHRALAEADEHQAAGRDDLAAAALEAERTTLAQVHRRLQERLAAASVEREAEAVVAGARTGPVAAVEPQCAAAEPAGAEPSGGAARRVDGALTRMVASAVAAVVGVVLLAGPDLATGRMTTAGTDSEPATPPDPIPTQDRGTPAAPHVAPSDPGHASPAGDQPMDGSSHDPARAPRPADETVGAPVVPVPDPPDDPLGALDVPLPRIDLLEGVTADEPSSDATSDHERDWVPGRVGERVDDRGAADGGAVGRH